MVRHLPMMVVIAVLSGCSREARDLGPGTPLTPPIDHRDPRIASYQDNFSQIAAGGRYFAWYGCTACHDEASPGVRNLTDQRWRHGGGFAQVYRAIADRHGRLAYRERASVETLWQLTAFVRDLPRHHPEKRRRLDRDEQAEPRGAAWSGPQ
jgi:cytochrome c oxidase cbb3-type subunit 3